MVPVFVMVPRWLVGGPVIKREAYIRATTSRPACEAPSLPSLQWDPEIRADLILALGLDPALSDDDVDAAIANRHCLDTSNTTR